MSKQKTTNTKKKKDFNHLKRKNVEAAFSYLSVLIFTVVFGAVAVFLLVIPRSTESQIEKRTLAKFPVFSFDSYFKGEYTAKIAEFYDDTVPFRDDFKTLGYNFKSVFGFHTDEEVKVIGNIKAIDKNKDKDKNKKTETSGKPAEQSKAAGETSEKPQESTASAQESKAPESSEEKPEKMGEAEYTEENGLIVVKHNGHYRALELFGGGTGDSYVAALNNYHKDLGDKVKIYSVTAPLASEYYTPSNYSGYTTSQKECFDDIASRLDDGIVYVDIDTPLSYHTNEDIYFRTDHHWSPLGAYYAAQTFADAAGVDFKDLSTYKSETIEGFVGTMYAFTGDANINNDPEDFTYYIPENYDKCKTDYFTTSFQPDGSGNFFCGVGDPQHNAYLTFMGGDEQIVKVTTNVKNGRKLMIVKDSYGNAVPGYLFGSFEEIYVVDMRYCDVNLVNLVKDNGVTDLAFVMCAYSEVGGNADNLDVIRTQ